MQARGSCRPQRILWIAYVFPPVGGGQGRRMRRFLDEIVKEHPGTVIDVLTIHPDAAVPQRDDLLGSALPAPVRVHRVRAGVLHHLRYRCRLDALALALPAGWRRRAVLGVICLSNVAWIPRAAALLWRQRYRYTAVYTFVDPFVSVVLALLAGQLNPAAAVVLEYGDPRIPCRTGPRLLLQLGAWLEERALLRCSAAVFCTSEVVRLYQSRFPSVPAGRYHILYGGVDWEAYGCDPQPPGQPEFRIVYTGTIYADSVDPSPFIYAIAKVVRDGYIVTVHMAGTPDPGIIRLVRELALEPVMTFLGHVPADLLPPIQRSAALLLAFGVHNPYKISNKLAEYVAARVPILYVAGSSAEPGARLVSDARRGIVVANEINEIAECIKHAYKFWQGGTLSQQYDLGQTGEFSFSGRAGELFSLLQAPEGSW